MCNTLSRGDRNLVLSTGLFALGWAEMARGLGLDGRGVDVTVSACQKGLMTPAGISFLFLNEKADRARESAGLVTPYWDWRPRVEAKVFARRFAGTAPTRHLFGLRVALDILLHDEGLEAVWIRHRPFARAFWTAVDASGAGGNMRLNIRNAVKRSSAVTTIWTSEGEGRRLPAWTEHEAGLTLGLGLLLRKGENADRGDLFRIGHMGHLNIPMMRATLGTIDAGLKTLGIPHGDGGLTAATRVIAEYER